VYWKLYAQINQRLNFLEESERGYKRALELGNYELDTWISRGDILIKLSEYEAAIFNFEQCVEFYHESEEVEYTIAGLNLKLQKISEGIIHLNNALTLNFDYNFIIEELFPNTFKRQSLAKTIAQFKKASSQNSIPLSH